MEELASDSDAVSVHNPQIRASKVTAGERYLGVSHPKVEILRSPTPSKELGVDAWSVLEASVHQASSEVSSI